MEVGKKDHVLEELIDDAILVASFGQRSGRFADNDLFAAIRAARANPDLDWSSEETVGLQSALNKAVRMIQPVTLIDLRSGWNPFRRPKESLRSRTNWMVMAFIVGTSLLILACGYYTVWYQHAAALIDRVGEQKAEKQSEVIYEIMNAMATIRAGDDGTTTATIKTDDLSAQSIREKIDLARRIDKELEADRTNYYEVSFSFVPATQIVYSVLNWLHPIGAAQAAEPAAKKPVTQWRFAGCYDGGAPAASGQPGAEPAGSTLVQGVDHFVTSVDRDVAGVRCALKIVQTNYGGVFQNPKEVVRQISDKMELLNAWLLPALYGALGALMFHMRAFLDPMLPNPAGARVLLRVSLGAFAGISVAWFLTPAVKDGVGGLGLGMLTIAFLLGFSIDVFFALLDRLVTLARNAISNLGGASQV